MSSIDNKYRVREVAKDFGLNPKQITDILSKYRTAPKSSMQVMEKEDLDVIFDYLTQKNQVNSIAEVFAPPAPKEEPKPEKAPEKAPEQPVKKPAEQHNAPRKTAEQQNAPRKQGEAPKQDNKPAGAKSSFAKPAQGQQNGDRRQGGKPQGNAPAANTAYNNSNNNNKPAANNQQPQQQSAPKPEKQHMPRQVAEKRVVDTRGSTAANLSKYDEKYENLAGEKTGGKQQRAGKERMGGKQQGKDKFNKKNPQNASAKQRQEERDRMQRLQLEIVKQQQLKVSIPEEISVGELASRMKKTAADVIKRLIKMGMFCSVSDVIDYDTAALVAMEMDCIVEKEVIVTVEERLIDDSVDTEEELLPRAPVVVVMGHVDHGKTSLLDYIRKTRVASGEAGGITQHIGAYTVEVNGSPVTFLDTPGHEAFTSMRARGAMVTDIAILVVAADDGIMPQTIESINHAKAAGIPMVVAINKMDVVGANPDRIKQQLTEYDILPEEWGGDTIVCPISAKTGMGIPELLENLVILAEVQELKANPNRAAKGTVIEARLDKGRGPVMTVLVQNGTLKSGDIVIAGTAVGKVRVMTNDKGRRIPEAGPSVPVEITGMSEVPEAGDIFNAVADERMARELADERKEQKKNAALGGARKVSLEDLFSRIQEGELKDFNIIVKADVMGSCEAVKTSLEKLSNEEVRVKVIHSAVGAINESDVMLASTSGAIIVGFNVRPDNAARDSAARSGVDIRMYRVIYDAIEEIEAAMKGMLAPKYREALIGHAEIRETYKVSKVGTVCGCYVTDGKIQRGCKVRILRDNIVIHEGDLASLRRFKDDVKEVNENYECGMQIEKFNDVKVGDIIECFIMEEIKQ